MAQQRFTKDVLDGWRRTAATGAVISDTTPGLVARALKRGVCFEWRGRVKRGPVVTVRLGMWRGPETGAPSFNQLTVERARSLAAKVADQARDGYDPRAKEPRPRPVLTVERAIDAYDRQHQGFKRQGAAVIASLRAHLKPHLARPLDAISRDDLKAVLKPYMASGRWSRAHRCLRDLSAFWNWCEVEFDLEKSPARHLKLPVAAPRREHTPSIEECRRIFAGAGGITYFGRPAPQKTAYIRLVLLTGLRKHEAADLRWSEVQGDRIVIPASRTKQQREHVLPITAGIREQLMGAPRLVSSANGRVFTALGSFDRLCKATMELSGTSGWCLHDFRRSIRSHLRDADVARDVVEKILGHSNGGTDAHYNHATLMRQMRAALELWERMLTGQ